MTHRRISFQSERPRSLPGVLSVVLFVAAFIGILAFALTAGLVLVGIALAVSLVSGLALGIRRVLLGDRKPENQPVRPETPLVHREPIGSDEEVIDVEVERLSSVDGSGED